MTIKNNIFKRNISGFLRHCLLHYAAVLLVLLMGSAGVKAQTANGYIIYCNDYSLFLAHDASSGAVNNTGVSTFDPATCLWSVEGNYIRPTSANGTTVLGGQYLSHANNALGTATATNNAAWNNATVGNNPQYTSGRNTYRLRITGGTTWQVGTSTNHYNSFIYAVTSTSTTDAIPAAYNGSLSGTTSLVGAGATSTLTPAATHTAAYNLTTVTYSYSGGELGSTTTGTVPTPTTVSLDSGWELAWSLSDDTYATISDAGVVTVKSTLPATYATTTVTLTATRTDGTGSFTASLPITIYASEDIQTNVVGGTQGVSSGTVTLNDYEDHSWSYYSDATLPARMRSLLPANVVITYYGNGTNTVSTNTGNSPALSTFTASTNNSVAVGIGEPEDTFVYYKTLERTSGNAYGSAAYNYTTIPNPFSIRPTYGSGDTSWRGFYAWRIKSVNGGTISGKSAGDIIDAEATVSFIPTGEYGMTVELEALWARAYVGSGLQASVGRERNFIIVSSNTGSTMENVRVDTPCTYSSFYPNGTTNGTAAATLANRATRRATFTPTADSKIEYMLLNGNGNNYDISANAHNLTLGRGIGAAGGTYSCNNFSSINSNQTAALDFTVRVESGVYNRVYLMSNGNTISGRVHNHLIFGSDYDRAKGDDSMLDVARSNQINFAAPSLGAVNKDQPVLDIEVKSGEYQRSYWYDNNTSAYNYSFYCHSTENNSYPGLVSLTVEGGHLANINGGRGSSTEGRTTPDSLAFTMRFKGGIVENSIYGAASNNPTYGSRRMIFTGGEVKGWVVAGCNGTGTDNNAYVTGNSYIYVGGNTKIGNANEPRENNGTPGGSVYGAGRGNDSHRASITNSHVAVADNAEILENVFGGGFHGYITNTSNVFVLGGTVHGRVYGGGSENGDVSAAIPRQIPTVNIVMTGGLVEGGVYGGSYTRGIVSSQVNMQIDGGQVGTSTQPANIHGGGYGQNTQVNGNVDVTIGDANKTESLVIYGDVYGGSALGTVNTNDSNHTYVTLNKGTINGSLYGGALGNSSTPANVNGPVKVEVYGGTVNTTTANGSGAVYGCNNINGAPQSTVTVDIYGTDPAPDADHYALDAVYGGGNRSDYNDKPVVKIHNCSNSIAYVYGGGNASDVTGTDVTIYGGNTIGTVFGGGNGAGEGNPGANITSGGTDVKIYGGTIGQVFGGSNAKGTITGDIKVNIDKQTETGHESCLMKIGEVYSGGNKANSAVGTITVGCTGDLSTGHASANGTDNRIGYELEGIGDLYGGSREADNTGKITLNITSGIINRVFGGNNISGYVAGDIEVNINKTGDGCGWYVGDVFGGGNQAAYSKTPDVNIQNGTVSRCVYGGGNEAGVAGGDVAMTGGTVLGGIYGGCNTSGTVGGNILVNLTGGIVGAANAKANVHGGGYGKETATSGNVDVNINGASLVIYGDVYGGSALGDVNSGTEDYTHVNLNAGTIHGDAYGGGLGSTSEPAWVFGNVKVTQNGVIFIKSIATEKNADGSDIVNGGRIFGCNNLNGSPKGTVLVLVKKTIPTSGTDHVKGTYDMAAVYGGGNLAAYDPTTPTATGQYAEGGHDATNKPLQVVINGCDDVSIEYVYGGGNAAATPATDVVVLGAYELGNVFGGGNGKDKISYDGTTWTANPGADVGIIDQTAYAANSSTGTYGTGKSLASLLGGTIHYAFGGSNTKGNVLSEATVYLNESDDGCPLKIDEVYGGGNEAYMAGDTQIQLGCISYLKEIYGGAKAADLGGNVVLTITSGSFDRVFGGNNVSGCINGSITVNIEETGCHPIVIGELYAGGNQAGYSIYGYKEVTEGGKQVWKPRESATDAGTGPTTAYDSPVLNVKSFTSIGRIFGGGFGETAVMVGDPTVNINEVEGTKSNKDVTDGTYNYDADATTGHFDTNGNFKGWAIEYKDDSLNPTTVTSTVNVPTHNKGKIGAIGTVFGGGNAAKVIGNTNVNIGTLSKITYVSGTDSSEKDVIGVDIRENVFGGGNQADVTGNTNVVVGK